MLCDAFLFKNVICVINSRMCLAQQCLSVPCLLFLFEASVNSEVIFEYQLKLWFSKNTYWHKIHNFQE